MSESASNAVPKISGDGEINVVSPLDSRVVNRIPIAEPTDLPARRERAREAQAEWAAIPLNQRAKRLRKLKKVFVAHADELVEAVRIELGRHPAETWFAEIVPNVDLIQWWTGPGRKYFRSEQIGLNPLAYPRKKAAVHMVPRGVLGLITPWNYPIAIPLRSLIPALLGGNAVLWKPSEYSAHLSSKLAPLFDEVLPTGVLQVLQGDGRTGAALLDYVDGVGFTGSLRTGQAIAEHTARRLIPSSLELGGKDFAVVMADSDLERAAAGVAWAALSNAGQNCSAVEVVAVDQSIAPKFQELLQDEIRQMAPFVGPVINERQKRTVMDQLSDAVDRGALVVEGGLSAPEGLRIEPTLIERATEDSRIFTEETFGPVLPLVTYNKLDEVSAWLNQSAYGLTLSVWSRNFKRARAWAVEQPVGVVTVNNHAFTAAIPAMPWTGVKGSGLGVTNGPFSLEWMMRPQGVLVDRAKGRELWWHPFNEAAIRMARGMAHLTAGVGSPLKAIKNAIVGMMGRWK